MTTLASAGSFAIQNDDQKRGFRVTRGVSFYMVVVAVILAVILSVMGLYETSVKQSDQVQPETRTPEGRKLFEMAERSAPKY